MWRISMRKSIMRNVPAAVPAWKNVRENRLWSIDLAKVRWKERSGIKNGGEYGKQQGFGKTWKYGNRSG